jgi:hypothetical protein
MLDIVVKRLNQATGMPLTPYVDREPQAGNFHLERAYGAVSLHRMCATGTGSSDVFAGYFTNRELYLQIHALLRGIQFEREGV